MQGFSTAFNFCIACLCLNPFVYIWSHKSGETQQSNLWGLPESVYECVIKNERMSVTVWTWHTIFRQSVQWENILQNLIPTKPASLW